MVRAFSTLLLGNCGLLWKVNDAATSNFENDVIEQLQQISDMFSSLTGRRFSLLVYDCDEVTLVKFNFHVKS
jgi:hypothetical protein